jgi:hypothetical protein
MNEQKQYRDNLERELNIADGMVRVGGVSGEQSGIISASDDSDDAPGHLHLTERAKGAALC